MGTHCCNFRATCLFIPLPQVPQIRQTFNKFQKEKYNDEYYYKLIEKWWLAVINKDLKMQREDQFTSMLSLATLTDGASNLSQNVSQNFDCCLVCFHFNRE